MVYGVTIPKRAQNPVTARAFVAFLLDKQKGMAIMERNGQPPVPIGPSAASAVETIPHELKRFIVKPDAGKPAP